MAAVALVGSGTAALCVVPGRVDSPAPGVMPEYVGFPTLSATPEFVDSLRAELAQRKMPERILYLPYALADQTSDSDRAGLWAVPALDALRWAGLNRGKIVPSDTLERGHCQVEVAAGSLEGTIAGNQGVKAAPIPADSRSDSDAQKGTKSSTDTVIFPDIRTDIRISTAIALDRLQELYSIFGDWDRAIVAYAQSPTAATAIKDSTAIAEAGIIRSLREAECKFAHSPAPAAFEGLETLAASRKAEREAQLLADSAARKARIDRLRALQAANIDRITYTIRKGDTLGGIAARHKVKVADLKRWNSLSGDFIREGRKLVIYIR